MLHKQLINAEKIVEKFEIRCFVEKERITTPIRLGLIQKKKQDYTIKGNVRPKTAYKAFLLVVHRRNTHYKIVNLKKFGLFESIEIN